jgi:hypothetical protein
MKFDFETAKAVRQRYQRSLNGTPYNGDSDNGRYFVNQVVIAPFDAVKASEFRMFLRLNNYDWQKALLLSGFDKDSVAIEVHCYYRPVYDIILMYAELDSYLGRNNIEKDYSAT